MITPHTELMKERRYLLPSSRAFLTAAELALLALIIKIIAVRVLHHRVEDTHLWPRVRRAAAGRPEGLDLLSEMEAEHAQVAPLLAAVDDALAGPAGDLPAHAAALASALEWHLKHEEEAALPLIQAVCTPADWRAFGGEMRRRQGVKGAAVYVPWVLDGAGPDGQQRFLAALPPPVRVISRRLWEPRYRKRGLWRA